MGTDWNDGTKRLVAVGLIIFGLFVLYLSRSVVTLVIVAALIAFLLMPFVKFLHQRLKLPRMAAVLLVHIILIIIILLSPLILLPPIISGFNELANVEYRVIFDAGFDWTVETLRELGQFQTQILGILIDLSGVTDPALRLLEQGDSSFFQLPSFETMINSVRTAFTVTVGVAANVAGSVFSAVLSIVLTFFFSIYISLDAHQIRGNVMKLVPEPYQPEISTLLKRLTRIWRAYFRGQLELMLIIGIMTWIVGLIIGLPNAFTLAVMAGVMELIPGVGPFLAAVPAVLVALIQGSNFLPFSNLIFAVIVIGCYFFIQQIENNFIVPRVLGEAVELPALAVMIGVVVGASVAGILGALLAAPVIASTREIVSYLYAKLLGKPPFPEEDTSETEKASWTNLWQGLVTRLKRDVQSETAESKPVPPESSPESQSQ